MTPINVHQINDAIVRALKLEGQRVTKVVLTFDATKLPTAEISRIVDNNDADGIVTAIEVLQLQPVPAP